MIERYAAGDLRALARLITVVESGLPEAGALLRAARRLGRRSRVVGITGSPGSGKSTLTDALIAQLRAAGQTVAVAAVDPSSPFSGGAILGDRIRMLRHHADTGVFVRSMASRGALGGLSNRTLQVLALLENFGFDYVFIETVGVGQSEVDIARVADHTVLVLTPNQGDAVQAFKAGVMEIADVFVVNKSDLPGASRLVRELRAAQGLAAHTAEDWLAPVVQTTASDGSGVDTLLARLEAHRAHLGEVRLEARRLERTRFEVRLQVHERVLRAAQAAEEDALRRILKGEASPEELADRLLSLEEVQTQPLR
nr:methylmalonyl Co-A mutase-associated GTPase MeaB [Deinobacterium chartae]